MYKKQKTNQTKSWFSSRELANQKTKIKNDVGALRRKTIHQRTVERRARSMLSRDQCSMPKSIRFMFLT